MKNVYIISILFLSIFTTNAHSVAVKSLEISNWNLDFGAGDIWDTKYTFMTVEMGQYQGEASFLPSGEVDLSTAILGASIIFYANESSTMGVFTAPSTSSHIKNVPSGDLIDNILDLDLSSWTVYVSTPTSTLGTFANSSESVGSAPVNIWSTPVMTTYDPLTQYFTANWDYRDTRSFTGEPSTIYSWHLEGYVKLVPIPNSIWLLISGFIFLFGFLNKRKLSELPPV